jgi:hypothetical protein
MGGNAFLTKGIQIDRVSASSYAILVERYDTLLRSVYSHVKSPPVAPEKSDHGDVDFIVAGRKDDDDGQTFSTLHDALNAKAVVNNGQIISFAISHPDSAEACFQLDIHECSSETFDWKVFEASYGDFASILRTMLKPLGLRMNDTGLDLVVEELQRFGKKASVFRLTTNPSELLQFLGLEVAQFAAGFESEERLFGYIMSGHLSYSRTDSAALSPSSRTRVRKRPMYRRFVMEYIPNVNAGENEVIVWKTRKQALEVALEYFGYRQRYLNRVDESSSHSQGIAKRSQQFKSD